MGFLRQRRSHEPLALRHGGRLEQREMLEGQFAGLFSRVGIFHCLSDNLRVVSLADHLVKAAIGTASAYCRQMTILTAIDEDRLKRVAGKALKLDICPGEESAAFRC